jgi:hypothetical protein
MKLCPNLAKKTRGLVCGAYNGECTEKNNHWIECPIRDNQKVEG